MANETIKQITSGGVSRDIEDAAARQAAAAAYQKPAGGIPATDLATAVQTSLGKADTALQAADKTQLQGTITQLQNALNTLIGGNVQGAIDTFNEVTAFLNGIDTSDPTLFNQLKSLSDAITALQNTLSQKANDNAVVKSISVNGTAQTKDGNGNVNVSVPTLTFDDAPTAGSNNAVKSGGIKTAIDQVTPTIDENGKWVIGGVTTDKDAQGPRGNTVLVNENAVGIQGLIVNNVFDGGEDEILSAEMGKVIRQNIMRIFSALGNYAFPEGKPVLSWGSTVVNHSINTNGVTGGLTISDVEIDGSSVQSLPSQVVEGKSLSFKLNLPSNLHIFDEVSIMMDGIEYATDTNVWNESTGVVNIASVTGDVVINISSMTYVSRGLVMHLDGRNRGGTAGKWKSLVDYNNSPLYFKLENCDEQSDYVAGNGTSSKGTAFSDSALTTPVTLLDVGAADGTIEAAYSHAEIASNGNLPIMHNGLGSGNRICLTSWHAGIAGTDENVLTFCTAPAPEFSGNIAATLTKSKIQNGGLVSCKLDSVLFNGVSEANLSKTNQSTTEESKLSIFYRRTSNDQYAKFRLYALRVYSVQLDDAERAQNLAIDQKRFNLS